MSEPVVDIKGTEIDEDTEFAPPILPALEPVLGNEMVIIYVGRKRKEFTIHKKLLCTSKYFNVALNGPFIESQKGVMYLENDSPDAFALYVEYLYRKTIRFATTEDHLHNLFDLYILSDKICDIEAKDMTMDAIQDMAWTLDLGDELLGADLLTKVFNYLPTHSRGLKNFCANVMAYTFFFRGSVGGGGGEDQDQYSQLEESTTYLLRKSDLHHMWSVSKGDFNFFVLVQDEIMRLAEDHAKSRELFDPRDRIEVDKQERCSFHCHEKDSDCRAYVKLASDLKFIRREVGEKK